MQKLSNLLEKYWYLFVILVPLVASVGVVGYNKYLDWQNVNNMRELVSALKETKNTFDSLPEYNKSELYVDCGVAGEKFSQSTYCDIVFSIDKSIPRDVVNETFTQSRLTKYGCRQSALEKENGTPFCDIETRPSTVEQVAELFRDVTEDWKTILFELR
jgi:hypothetical protein